MQNAERQTGQPAQALADMGIMDLSRLVARSTADVFASRQMPARGMQMQMAHPASRSGRVALIGNPLAFSQTPVACAKVPPTRGAEAMAVLGCALALGTETLQGLATAGVIEGKLHE